VSHVSSRGHAPARHQTVPPGQTMSPARNSTGLETGHLGPNRSGTKRACPATMDFKSNLTSIAILRQRAKNHLEKGAVTESYGGDIKEAIELLNQALATEVVCVLRYRNHHFMANGIASRSVASEFLVHSNQEQGHADQLAARIVQLGGSPELDPSKLAQRSHAEYIAGTSIDDMIRQNLIAERIAIDSYREMIAYFSRFDPTTRLLLEGILAVEEEHADDLASLLDKP